MIDCPSGEKLGSVSIPELWLSRCNPLPSAFTRKICEPPIRDSTTASFFPSGDHAGALLLPLKLATALRALVASVCMYTTGFLFSKDTYASCLPSGDHAGDMIGSVYSITG